MTDSLHSHDRARLVLLGSVFVVASCGIVYELVSGAVSSYILGDAVTQFSLVIGVFLCAMGLGSFLAKFITSRLLETFVEIEIWIGLVGGLSSLVMFGVSGLVPSLFAPFFYTLCAVIGVMVGIEIPLIIRILDRTEGLKEAVSHVLAFDYLGALAGSVLFPFLVLPFVGLSRASLVFGIMNLGVAAAGIQLIKGPKRGHRLRLAGVGAVLLVAMVFSGKMVGFLEDLLYQDHIVFAKDSPYQRIVLTRWQDDVRLYLNGHIQFCSIDEARYHEALVIPAMEAAPRPRNVLILGGGDGLAAREVLKYQSVEKIVLVDLDPVMTELGRKRPELLALNQGSLNSAKLLIVNQDAMTYLETSHEFFDVMISDLPDPHTPNLCKLYSRSFFALMARRLAAGGVMVTQATSPFFAPEAFWCIERTIAEAVHEAQPRDALIPLPYHVHVPSFGDWGFVMASGRSIRTEDLNISVSTRFLTRDTMLGMFHFSKDMERPEVRSNRLNAPVLFEYYRRGWEKWND